MSKDFWDEIGSQIVFKAFGKRSDIEEKLEKITSSTGVGVYVKTVCCDNTVKIDTSTLSKSEARKLTNQIFNSLEEKIYSDVDISLARYVIDILKLQNKTLGVSESLTGGMIADSIVSIPGASEVFSEGLVCYSNQAKMKVLGVKRDTLADYTAVSSQTAYEMACGILDHKYNDYALSTTGYAENYGGEENGGRVFIGVGSRERIDVHEYSFDGDRSEVRQSATNAALFHLVKRLKGSFDYIR
jgi:nicotinamide-nucleotide amidase